MENDNKVAKDRVSYISDSSISSKQIEVSHGSTSNQPSLYQSQDAPDNINTSCWCVIFCISAMFGALLFLLLVLCDAISPLKEFFQAHPNDNKIVLALVSVVAIILLIIIVFRCVRRHKYSDWFRKISSKFPQRKAFYDNFDEPDGDSISQNSPTNPKLMEMCEEKLKDIERILQMFLKDHDEKDWLFSPSSTSASSRKGFSGNALFQQVEQSVKLKFSVKVILAGPPNVGKTSIFHRILYDRFSEYYMATLGADLAHVSLHLFPGQPQNHVLINLQLWDIAGSENFRDLHHIVYKDATCFIIICDVTYPNHLTQALPWVEDIRSLNYQPFVALFFNKIDLQEEQLSSEETFPENTELTDLDKYYVSAKTGEKVLENMLEVFVKSILHEIKKLL